MRVIDAYCMKPTQSCDGVNMATIKDDLQKQFKDFMVTHMRQAKALEADGNAEMGKFIKKLMSDMDKKKWLTKIPERRQELYDFLEKGTGKTDL